MNARRPPSAPPEIPGFGYLQLLGSGGFADVFLYEQRMPRRRVAIKVLLSESLTEGARDSFDAEANLMAQLSTHPSIVTIYQADIAGDGRPYLAMEYCPKPNLGARYRREKISVAEALRIGIQVAGAVETAHRAGILHRDIKPANILVTEYNRPALTDFGISVALVGAGDGGGAEQESVGMSIPWSPPEVFGATPASGAAADIYSLGATVYTILAGRSPFEVPGGSNNGLDLIARIQSSPLSKTGRADVPAALEEVLATAMAKREDARYSSALEFARALQKVQLELSLSVTPTDVLDDQLPADELDEEDEGHTRIRGMVSIDPTAPVTGRRGARGGTTPAGTAPAPTRGPAPAAVPPAGAPRTPWNTPAATTPAAPPEEHTVVRGTTPPAASGALAAGAAGVVATGPSTGAPSRRGFDEPGLEETQHRTPAAPGDADDDAARRPRTLPYILGAAALVLVLAVGGIVFALNTGGSPASDDIAETSKPVDQIDVSDSVVPAPTGVAGTASPDGSGVVFTWTNPDPQPGDRYIWTPVVQAGQEAQSTRIDADTVTVPLPAGQGRQCIDVVLLRSNGKGSDPATGCGP